jgi:hypothetical protein
MYPEIQLDISLSGCFVLSKVAVNFLSSLLGLRFDWIYLGRASAGNERQKCFLCPLSSMVDHKSLLEITKDVSLVFSFHCILTASGSEKTQPTFYFYPGTQWVMLTAVT